MRLEHSALRDLLAGEPRVSAPESRSLARLCQPLPVCDARSAQSLMCGWLLVKGPERVTVAREPEAPPVVFGVPLCELAGALVRATGCPHLSAWRHLEAELDTDLRAHLWAMAEPHRVAAAASTGARVALGLHLEACLQQQSGRAQPRAEARARKLPAQLTGRAVGALGAACLFFSGVSELRCSRTSPPTAEAAELCRRGPRELLTAMLSFGARGLRLQLDGSDGPLSEGAQHAARLELHALARALRALQQPEFRRAAAEAARRPQTARAGQLACLRAQLVAVRAAAWPALWETTDDVAQFGNRAVVGAAAQGAEFARQPAVGLDGAALDVWSPRSAPAPSESAWSGSNAPSMESEEGFERSGARLPAAIEALDALCAARALGGAPRATRSASSAASSAETVLASPPDPAAQLSPSARKREAHGEAQGSPSGGSPRLRDGPCSAHGPCQAGAGTEHFERCWVGVPRPLGAA